MTEMAKRDGLLASRRAWLNGLNQKYSFSPTWNRRDGAAALNCPKLMAPGVVLTVSTLVALNEPVLAMPVYCVWLKMLKPSMRNCNRRDSELPSKKVLNKAMSQLFKPGP